MSKLDKYFVLDEKNDCVRFIGDKLEIFIPVRYESKNFLIIEDKVHALGIFSMRVNDSIEGGLELPGVIQIDPVDTYNVTIDDVAYTVCVLERNSEIMTTTTVLQNNSVVYFIWTEFLSLGNMPSYVSYGGSASLFDNVKEIAGVSIPVNHSIFEIVLAHIFRDKNNLATFYRHTNMGQPPAQITLRDVAYGPSSTHSRMIGSYSDDGRNAALLNHSDQSSTLENYFRS